MTQPIQGDPGEYSRETREWLSEMVKIGFVKDRGTAWHYREGDGNHFDGPVPLEVAVNLFSFEVVKEPIVIAGKPRGDVAWYAPDYDTVFGYFKETAKIHPYDEWLVQNVDTLLDGRLEIGSVGLLRNRAVAFLQAEMPETVKDGSTGEAFRSSVLGFTSLDSTLATTYQVAFTRVVCDNTFSRARGENTPSIRLRHTRNSKLNVEDARKALGLLEVETERMAEEIRYMISVPVTERQWEGFLDLHVPLPEDEGRGRTMGEHKREALTELYHFDDRVAPWKGTAWGVQQAINTYQHHLMAIRKGAPRFERNMLSAAQGKIQDTDRQAVAQLNRVLDGALVGV